MSWKICVEHGREGIVGTVCGTHCGYEQARESVNFYENRYKIKKKIYRRKYLMERRLRPFNVGTEKYTMFVNMFKEIEGILKGMISN